MNRRDFILHSSYAAAALAARPARAGDEPAVPVTIGGPSGHTISPDFLGLGYEISSVATVNLLSSSNHVYVQLLQTLGPRGVIRVGGNTADYANYSAGKAVSSPLGTVVNDSVLKDLGGFLAVTGWQLIWALNLGRGSETDAVAEARAVLRIAGDHVLAFEIGNEPDLFSHQKHRGPGYDYADWLADYRRYKTALRAHIPRVPLAGPDAASKTDWVTRFAADEGRDAVLLTRHYYRGGGQDPKSTIENLLGIDPKLQPELDQLQAASASCGLPYRICEVNSFYGGGRPGVSDTLAGGLWALDYMFTLASNRCSGVNLETGVNQLGFISSYSPIGDDEHGNYSAKPEYYGMLAFSIAGRGQLLQTHLEANQTAIKAYATRPADGALRLTFLNKGETSRVLQVDTGHRTPDGKASVIRLMGPAIDAKTGITLGGAEVNSRGAWKPSQSEFLPLHGGRLRIPMPAASAAIVQMG